MRELKKNANGSSWAGNWVDDKNVVEVAKRSTGIGRGYGQQ